MPKSNAKSPAHPSKGKTGSKSHFPELDLEAFKKVAARLAEQYPMIQKVILYEEPKGSSSKYALSFVVHDRMDSLPRNLMEHLARVYTLPPDHDGWRNDWNCYSAYSPMYPMPKRSCILYEKEAKEAETEKKANSRWPLEGNIKFAVSEPSVPHLTLSELAHIMAQEDVNGEVLAKIQDRFALNELMRGLPSDVKKHPLFAWEFFWGLMAELQDIWHFYKRRTGLPPLSTPSLPMYRKTCGGFEQVRCDEKRRMYHKITLNDFKKFLKEMKEIWGIDIPLARCLSAGEIDADAFVRDLIIGYENDSEVEIGEPGKSSKLYHFRQLGFQSERTKTWKTLLEILQKSDHSYYVGEAYLYTDGFKRRNRYYDSRQDILRQIEGKLLGFLGNNFGLKTADCFRIFELCPNEKPGVYRPKFKIKKGSDASEQKEEKYRRLPKRKLLAEISRLIKEIDRTPDAHIKKTG